MMTDKICCNCTYYRGVNGYQGCAPCAKMDKMVLWNESCEDIWLIPKRMETGTQTNADRIRAMTDEELAKFIYEQADCFCQARFGDCIRDEEHCRKAWLKWLKEEVQNERISLGI